MTRWATPTRFPHAGSRSSGFPRRWTTTSTGPSTASGSRPRSSGRSSSSTGSARTWGPTRSSACSGSSDATPASPRSAPAWRSPTSGASSRSTPSIWPRSARPSRATIPGVPAITRWSSARREPSGRGASWSRWVRPTPSDIATSRTSERLWPTPSRSRPACRPARRTSPTTCAAATRSPSTRSSQTPSGLWPSSLPRTEKPAAWCASRRAFTPTRNCPIPPERRGPWTSPPTTTPRASAPGSRPASAARFSSNRRSATQESCAKGLWSLTLSAAGRRATAAAESLDFDLDVGGRDRDRSVEGSTPLEGGDQLPALFGRHALEIESQPHSVEEGHVRPNRVGAVHLARDRDPGGLDRDAALPGDDLHQLDATGPDTGKEDLRRRDRLARASVLHWSVHHEMVVPARAEHAPEGVGGPGLDFVTPDIGLRHGPTSCDCGRRLSLRRRPDPARPEDGRARDRRNRAVRGACLRQLGSGLEGGGADLFRRREDDRFPDEGRGLRGFERRLRQADGRAQAGPLDGHRRRAAQERADGDRTRRPRETVATKTPEAVRLSDRPRRGAAPGGIGRY